MSTSETKIPDPTKGSYWGGPILSFDTYWWLAVLPTGFFGIDHLALRSPSTAWKKFLINIFTFGAWWFYDIFQVIGDKANIARYGLTSPLGALGIGYNLFTDMDNKKPVPPSPNVNNNSTLFYILYVVFMILPIGLSNMLAGDLYGGVVRLMLSIFLFPVFLIYGIIECWNTSAYPADVFDKGISRKPPIPFLLKTDFYPPTNLVSESKAKPLQVKYDNEVNKGYLEKAVESVAEVAVNTVGAPLLSSVGAVVKGACVAGDAATKTGEAAAQISKAGPNLKAAMNSNPSPVPSAPNLNNKLADPSPIIMKGGGELPTLGDGMLLSGILFLIIGGLGITFLRKMITNKKRDGKDPLDDSPPEARTF